MSFNTTPNTFKNLIISGTGNLCEKVAKLLVGFATASYNFVSEMIDESGNFTDNFKEMICAAGCTGSNGTVNPNMPAPSGVAASDGTYSDKVRVTWNAVTPPSGQAAVTEYKVYRAPSTVTDSDESVLIATVTAPTLLFDDTSAVVGTTYNYWVRATNGTQTSNYGGPDVGNAGEVTESLPAISDLRATQGHYHVPSGYVSLAFTPQAGATKFDVYRHTANDFSAATKIASDKTPANTIVQGDTQDAPNPGDLWDNVTEYAYLDGDLNPDTVYYYWVVGKSDAPPASSAESNAATGFVYIGVGLTGASAFGDLFHDAVPVTVPAGKNRCRVRLWGNGGDGAGGDGIWGSGGGGGGGMLYADIVVSPGDTLELILGGGPHVNTAPTANGLTGADVSLELNSVEILRAVGGDGGEFDPVGSGAGGVGGVPTGSVAFTGFTGADGEDGISTQGGRGGHAFGEFRVPPAGTFLTFPSASDGFNGNALRASGGSGSNSGRGSVANCKGGKGGIPYLADATVGGIYVFGTV